MFEGDFEKEVLFLEERKGFIRFAITHGMNLVPIYGFGENKVYQLLFIHYYLFF